MTIRHRRLYTWHARSPGTKRVIIIIIIIKKERVRSDLRQQTCYNGTVQISQQTHVES